MSMRRYYFFCILPALCCAIPFASAWANNEKVLYSFTDSDDGADPEAGLIRDTAGNLYGTTYDGGAYGAGVVFKVARNGTQSVLHTFGAADGRFPAAALIQDDKGNFYGTTSSGGTYSDGTVF